MIVCILGMQRSGTSLVTRMVNLLGVHLGPEDQLIPARTSNPTGFWEHRGIQKVNEEILAVLHGSWTKPPIFRPNWEHSAALDPLREKARALVARDFGDVDDWGWKDPTTCLTLPFWQSLLPRIRYVIALRNPQDSAQSLQRRDGLSLADGMALWLIHLVHAYAHTAGEKRTFVFYEDVMADWRLVSRHLAHFLDRPGLSGDPGVQDRLAGFVDQSLYHHRMASSSDVPESAHGPAGEVCRAAQNVFEVLRAGALREDATAALGTAMETVEHYGEVRQHEAQQAWWDQLRRTRDEIDWLVPHPDSFILVDGGQFGDRGVTGHRAVPFLEKNGQYWGPPPDDATAIKELERLRSEGAGALVVAWPAFWWLDYYPRFHQYLRSHFPCLKENERIVAFALHSARGRECPERVDRP